MKIAATLIEDKSISCATCRASCCRLEVMLITETGVPEQYIQRDEWGGEVMARLEDGWCAALDRDTMLCSIYENRPFICREFATGSYECLEEYEPR
jgi:Fe-S-cluster containining protein